MFNFFNFFQKTKEKKDEEIEKHTNIGSGLAINNSINKETTNLRKVYAKPKTYTGNRKLFDSGKAKKDIKLESFSSGGKVIDEYTGKELELTIKEAKMKYGKNWQEHVAEVDHLHPLKRTVEENKENPWVTVENIKEIANSKENMKSISRKVNNAKRDRTNEEFVTDDKYLKKQGITLAEENKRKAIKTGKEAKRFIKQEIRKCSIKNAISSGHKSGIEVAKNAVGMTATISGILNITEVIKGEKTIEEATKDVAIATTKSAATSYVLGNSGTVISHSLGYSKSSFLKALSDSNVPAKVITAVVTTGDIIKKYSDGEITTQECILELGERGLNIATTGYSMAAGQALIPIPIVGAAVGALVGSVLTSKYYNSLISDLKNKELEHKERLRIMAECKELEIKEKAFRKELQEYLDFYFYDYKNCFDEALSEIEIAFKEGNTDGIITGANKITQKLGGRVYYNNVTEFKNFLENDNVDEF